MKLSEKQHAELLQHLKTKWVAPAVCPVCRSNDWQVATEVFELREFNGGNMVIGGGSAVFPISPVTCKTCGNTLLINSLIAGLVLQELKK